MTNQTFHLGIDPGWRNLGYALLSENAQGELSLVRSGTDDVSKDAVMYASSFAATLHSVVPPTSGLLRNFTMERYVSYQGVNTAEAESILMTIGSLRQAMLPWVRNNPIGLGLGKLHMPRAIDWKTTLVKILAKHYGFNNPSTSLDKKFSVAAATCVLNGRGSFSNDHEADAVCLAALPALLEKHTGLRSKHAV